MKHFRSFGAALMLSITFLLGAGSAVSAPSDITLPSSIRSVVVYPDRAMIRRTATVMLKQGENIVRLPGITPNLIDESVEVNARNGRITDVKVERTFLAELSQEKMKNLEGKLDAIQGRIKTHSNEVAVLQNTVEFLKKLNPFPKGQKISPAEIETHLHFVEKSIGESLKETATLEEKIKKLTDEKKAVEEEMKRLRSSKGESKNIVVHILSDRDDSTEMTSSYVVQGVSWRPHYDVRADTQASRVELNSFAILRQSTGEDWKEVSLEVSTAKPSVRGTPPDLAAWFVDVYKPRPMAGEVYKSLERRRAVLEESLKAEEPEEAPAAKVQAEATSFSFVLPRKMDLPSDDEPHRVLLASATRETKFVYYAVPKMSTHAYLKTDLRNPFPFSLLSGGINLFVDGRFVSTTSLPKTILADENMGLSLGIDEAIKIDRKPVKKFTESVGTFTKETRESFEYATEIVNGKGKEIALEVKDACPVSRNEKIKVEMKSPGKGEANIAEDGIITWSVKLGPGEKKQVKTVFTVTYPRDLKVTGLE